MTRFAAIALTILMATAATAQTAIEMVDGEAEEGVRFKKRR
jgi:hypothetical protein